MSERSAEAVAPVEAGRMALVGLGAASLVVGLLWFLHLTRVSPGAGAVVVPGIGVAITEGSSPLEPPHLAALLGDATVAVGLGLIVLAVGLGRPAPEDRSQPGLWRRVAVDLGSLVAVLALIAVSVVALGEPVSESLGTLYGAFLFKLAVTGEVLFLGARLVDADRRGIPGDVGDAYERAHGRVELLATEYPRAMRWVRYGTLAAVVLVPLLVVGTALSFTWWGSGIPNALVEVLGYGVGLLVLLGLPAAAVTGVLPTPDATGPTRLRRRQRTLVFVGAAVATAWVLVTGWVWLSDLLAGERALSEALMLSPALTTPQGALLVGWLLILVGYGWRLADGLGATLSRALPE